MYAQISSCLVDHYAGTSIPIILILSVIFSIRNLKEHRKKSVLWMISALTILAALISYNYFFLHLSSDWLNSLLFGFFYSI